VPVQAAVAIPGLFNSGVSAGGGGMTSGTVLEQNWRLGAGQAWNSATIHGNWAANSGVSRWMTPAMNGTASFDPASDGLYVYSLGFDLTGYVPATARFAGRFMVDNQVTEIRLNGSLLPQGGLGTFNAWTGFSASSGFVGGHNMLSFIVRNLRQASGNPTGLRVEFQSSAVDAAVAPFGVPEPASWAMLIAGFGVVGGVARRRRAVVTA
jgi:hypothetical protein